MVPGDRERFIKFLAQNGINAEDFPDAELRQQTQKVQSEQKLKSFSLAIGKGKSKKKPGQGKLVTKKNPGK